MSEIRKKIAEEGMVRSLETRSHGLIGHVIEYYGETSDVEEIDRHTVDVKILLGKQEQILEGVPCFVYSQGILSDGLMKNDCVWVQFINGDFQYPVVTAFYREPTKFKLFVNSFKASVGKVFSEFGMFD